MNPCVKPSQCNTIIAVMDLLQEKTQETKPENGLPNQEAGEKKESFFKELVRLALIAVLIVIPFRIFIAQPFIVNGASMEPTFENGDYLIVDQLSYRFSDPKRGSVLIFKYPKDTSKYFIKRIIGLPGESISIKNGKVYIKNGDSELILEEPYIKYSKNESFEITLSQEEFFVMGDNRLGSADSRLWGPLPKNLIVGRPLIQLFPFNRISIKPGDGEELFKE